MSKQRTPLVISLVERGWQAARECSLDTQDHGGETLHMIKGYLHRDVQAMIAPKSKIHLLSLPKKLFWLGVWPLLVGYALMGRVRSLLVDNEQAYRRVRPWTRANGVNLVRIQLGAQGYEFLVEGRPISRAQWYQGVGLHALGTHL